MCGIWAIFGFDDDVTCKHFQSCARIRHRGPDAFRIQSISNFSHCCLGFHHLAIQDDVFGLQPMRIKRFPNLWLIYNGEIYNYKMLAKQYGLEYETHSDGEAILHLYNHGGADFMARHLDGVFAFCLLDCDKRKVFIGRDTFGVKPCFRCYTDQGFLGLCSEVKGLHGIRQVTKATISPLPPGHIETYDIHQKGKVMLESTQRFHSIGQPPLYKTFSPGAQAMRRELIWPWKSIVFLFFQDGDILPNIRLLLEAAVDKRLISRRRIGCLLSGGLDSSLVAAMVARKLRERNIPYPLQTFTIGMAGSPDLEAARKVARHIGSEHHEVTFTPEEALKAIRDVIKCTETYDDMNIRSAVGSYLLSQYIKQTTDTTVVLSGEGADELAQGYRYFKMAPTTEDASQQAMKMLEDIHYFDVLRVDRTTSACGLEVRVPFLDHQFTSYYLSLPTGLRFPKDGATEKYLIRKSFEGSGLLPQEILWRSKEPFSDGLSSREHPWFTILQNHAENIITDSMLDEAPEKYSFNPPRTKEAYLYRNIFEEFYPGYSSLIPYYWMQNWTWPPNTPPRKLTL